MGGRRRSDSTLYNYRRYVDRELAPVLGPIKLSKLSAHHLDQLYGDLTARGLAPASIRQVHAIIRASMNHAVRWGLVGRNVATLASAPGQPQREQHPPTAEQVQELLTAASSIDAAFGLFVRVVAATGVRRGEACGLRWIDVDFTTETLRVERSRLSVPGAAGDHPTKFTNVTLMVLAGTATLLGAATALVAPCAPERTTLRGGY